MTFSEYLPHFNASMNASSAILLVLGYIQIKKGNDQAHKRLMITAVCTSALFLTGYLTRHALTGTTYFQGTGTVRTLYLTILYSHMVIAVIIVPAILRILFLAHKERFEEHKKIARYVFPAWVYVSITGIVVYWMLYRL